MTDLVESFNTWLQDAVLDYPRSPTFSIDDPMMDDDEFIRLLAEHPSCDQCEYNYKSIAELKIKLETQQKELDSVKKLLADTQAENQLEAEIGRVVVHIYRDIVAKEKNRSKLISRFQEAFRPLLSFVHARLSNSKLVDQNAIKFFTDVVVCNDVVALLKKQM